MTTKKAQDTDIAECRSHSQRCRSGLVALVMQRRLRVSSYEKMNGIMAESQPV